MNAPTMAATRATDRALLGWAYEAHCVNCATCRRGETWCETGAAILTAIAAANTNSDLPGFAAI